MHTLRDWASAAARRSVRAAVEGQAGPEEAARDGRCLGAAGGQRFNFGAFTGDRLGVARQSS